MKLQARILCVLVMLCNGMADAAKEDSQNSHKSEQRIWLETSIKDLAKKEDQLLGAKVAYGISAFRNFGRYVDATMHGKPDEAAHSWEMCQRGIAKVNSLPSPYSEHCSYGLLALWMYNRIANPVGKKNLGCFRRNAARIMIPVWLCKDILFSSAELDKKKEALALKQEAKIKELQKQCESSEEQIKALRAEAIENTSNVENAFNMCLTMTEAERAKYRTSVQEKEATENASNVENTFNMCWTMAEAERAKYRTSVQEKVVKDKEKADSTENKCGMGSFKYSCLLTKEWWRSWLSWYVLSNCSNNLKN